MSHTATITTTRRGCDMPTTMIREKHLLKEWTRLIWTSEAGTTAKWKGIIGEISRAWNEVERWTVVDGVRDSALMFVHPGQMLEFAKWASEHGLAVLPMERTGIAPTYAAASYGFHEGKPWQYRVILTRMEKAADWYAASYGENYDHNRIGELLGFPDCCRPHFGEFWGELGFRDTTWPMAENTVGPRYSLPDGSAAPRIDIHDGFPEANILWHWMGVRLTPHLPCSFKCEASRDLARRWIECATEHGFGPQMDHALEILSWPVQWSALYGIAEIMTPILKCSSRTDTTAEEYVVRYHGSSYPEDGASGVVFPFRIPEKFAVTGSKRFARAFDDVVVPPPARSIPGQTIAPSVGVPASTWRDNGFSTPESMEEAHSVLLDVLRASWDPPHGKARVLDLGCGNGILLEKIAGIYKMDTTIDLSWTNKDATTEILPCGVECERSRFEALYKRLGNRGEVAFGPISNWTDLWPEDHYSLVVLMPRRIDELGENGPEVAERIRAVASSILLYGYDVDILEADGLEKLSQSVGLTPEDWDLGPITQTPHGAARLAVRRD